MKNINKSIENSDVVSILKTRTLFVLMLEPTLMKFEKEHSDLMCGYDEYGTVLELRDRKSKTLIGKWSNDELLCKALPFHDEIEMAEKGCDKTFQFLEEVVYHSANKSHEFDNYENVKKRLKIIGMDSESAKAETSVLKNCPHIRFGNLTFLVAVELNSGQISNSVSAISYPALEMWDLSEEDL